jgi:glyoxylase-like metal-dependent hydrolase (beta-lactamase superfamily II)
MTIARILTGLAARGDLWLASPAIRADEPHVTGFYEATSGSIQYVVADPISQKCAVIDPVLDFDPRSGSTRTTSADQLLRHIETHELTLEWVLDTDPHADHFSAVGYLRDITGCGYRHRRPRDRDAEALEANLQFAGHRPNRWVAVGSFVCRWRTIHGW